MKKIILFLFIIFIYTSANSQGFEFYRISPPIVYGDTAEYGITATKGVFKNTSSSPVDFTLARIVNNLPSGWTTSLCVGTNCYNSTQDTIPPRNSPLITIQPNATDTLIIDFNGIVIGEGMVVMQVWINNNPSNSIIDTFRVQLGPVGIQNISTIVEDYSLEQNYPNPFNPATKIDFSIKKNDAVTLKIYDIQGREVAVLLNNNFLQAGKYSYTFDAGMFNLSSGIYFYILKSNNFSAVKKMSIIK